MGLGQREPLVHHFSRESLPADGEAINDRCPVEGCPGPDVDHTGKAAIGCGLDRDSEGCEA